MTATYPGASAVAVEQSVATPIEQEVNGVDQMIYMKSSNTSDGRMQLDVNFQASVNQDTGNVLTQNRVSSAQARLPQEVIAQGVTVKKQSPSILMLISLYSPGESDDASFLLNYAALNLRDRILRTPGIAQVDLFGGAEYGLRIWLYPDKLAKLGLTPADMIAAIRDQNLQAPAGRFGAAPTPRDQLFTYTVSATLRIEMCASAGPGEAVVWVIDDDLSVRRALRRLISSAGLPSRPSPRAASSSRRCPPTGVAASFSISIWRA